MTMLWIGPVINYFHAMTSEWSDFFLFPFCVGLCFMLAYFVRENTRKQSKIKRCL